LSSSTKTTAGIEFKALRSINVDKFGCFEFLCDPAEPRDIEELWRFILSLPGYDAVVLDLLPESSPTIDSALKIALESGWIAHTEHQFSTPRKTLPSDRDDWGAGLKSKFKSNLRNREKRLARLGEVRFEMVRDVERVAELLPVFYRLESAGWKWEDQSSIVQKPHIKAFYDEFASNSGGTVQIAILWLDDRPIAAQLLRVMNGWLYILKIGHDPEYRKYSPGQLITRRTIGEAIKMSIGNIDFLGEAETWKSDWNPIVSTNFGISLFAPTWKGRLAYWATQGAREKLKQVPGARRLVAGIRRIGRRK
jgi:CelD/BcsL family acetyltransferase involved in cellulose biosynthesis